MTGEIHQDWKPVVIHNRNFKKAQTQSNSNPKPKVNYNDGEEDMPKRQEYSPQMIVAMQDARKAKNLTQSELAKQLNIDVKIIADIEAKKSAYNRKLYTSIMRKLGVDTKSLKEILI
jgi:ribosome-binding protein aMBF1 (putative translation factor)